MSQPNWTWQLEERLPSDHAAAEWVQEQVLSQLRALTWIEHDIFGIRLALEEALVNAIKHGNRQDPAKSVHFVCRLSAERIVIEISDEGPGFDPAAVPDPTDEEHLECPSGRGIVLMRAFMGRVEYNETGNRVVMEKERQTP